MQLVYQPQTVMATDNLLPLIYNFESDYVYTVSGTGTAENIEGFSFSGNRSLRLNNTDAQNTDLEVDLFTTPFKTENSGTFFLSLFLQNGVFSENDLLQIEMFKNGALFGTYDISPYDTEVPSSVTGWKRYIQNFNNSGGLNQYTFRIIVKANGDSVSNDRSFYIDGMKIEQSDKGLVLPSFFTEPIPLIINHTETIDIPSIGSNDTELVNVTILGAKLGMFVNMTSPPAIMIIDELVIGHPIVSATDTVSFIVHNHSGGSINPVSGTFNFRVYE